MRKEQELNELTRGAIQNVIDNDNSIPEGTLRYLKKALGNNHGKQKRELITTKEACAILGVNPVTLRRYEQRGIISAIRYTKRRIRWDKDDILELKYTGSYDCMDAA